MKNKKILIGIVVAVIIVILATAGYFVFGTHTSKQTEQPHYLDEDVTKLQPSDIGLQIVASPNKKQVKFVINKPDGFQKVEYELSYMANSTAADQAEGGPEKINRGIAGEDEITPDEAKYESKFLDLGSCSSGTCRYDTGVESVHLLLKLTKTDGKLYQVEDDLSLK